MALFRKDVLATAEKLVSKGRIEAAIKEYRKVLAKNPGDTNTLNRVGDLYVRLRKTDEAVGYYMKTAEQYALDGFYVKSIAVYKKVHRLDPSHVEVHRRLGELYRKQGLLNDALRHFNLVAEAALRNGNRKEALELYEQLIELEPANPTHYLRIADIHRESGNNQQALDYYGRIANLMLSHGQIDHALQVYDRAIRVDASQLDFISEALVALKDAGGEERARRFLESATELNPGAAQLESLINPPSIPAESALLKTDPGIPQGPDFATAPSEASAPAEVEGPPESPAETSGVQAEASSAPQESDAGAAALEPWPLPASGETPEEEAAVDTTPTDAAAEESVDGVPDAIDALAPSGSESPLSLDGDDPSEDSAAFEFEPEPELDLGVEPAAVPDSEVDLDPFSELLGDESTAPEEEIQAADETAAEPPRDDLLDVDLNFPKAPLPADFPGVGDDIAEEPGFDSLDLSLEDETVEETALDGLPDAAVAEGAEDFLVDAAEEVADESGDESGDELAAELVDEPAEEVTVGLDVQSTERLQEAEVFAKYGLIEKGLERLDEVLDTHPTHEATLLRWLQLGIGVRSVDNVLQRAKTLFRESGSESTPWQSIEPALLEAGFEVQGDDLVAPAADESLAATNIDFANLDSEERSDDAVDALPSAVVADSIPEGDAREADVAVSPPDSGEPSTAAPSASSDGAIPAGGDSLDDLDEVSGDASPLPAEVVTGDESISVADWLNEPSEEQAEAELFEEEELFDLAAELQDELSESVRADAVAAPRGDDEQSLEEIVEGFKKGVSENIPQEDADTHYNLGIAYREMMLLDEAISEFQISAKAPKFLVESCAMLGICFRDKGLPEVAIDWYQKALDSGELAKEQRLGMLYDMAQTYEAMADEERAYETFLEISNEDAGYRDVANCVERLRPVS